MSNTNFNPLVLVMGAVAMATWVVSNFFTPPVDANMLNHLQNQGQDSSVVLASENQDVADGLDLQALTELITTVKTAGELEEALNKPEGINNLDLNGDGTVDFIQVKEFGEQNQTTEAGKSDVPEKRGFTLLTEVAPGQVQEIATIEVIPVADPNNNKDAKVEVNTHGNEQVYGKGQGYSSIYPMASFFLMGYLLNSGVSYNSPYSYGRYPSYYNSFNSVDNSRYQSRASRYAGRFNGTTVNRGPTMSSPYRGQSASEGITRGLRNPTSSQRSFQSHVFGNRANLGQGGGFGRKNPTTATTAARRNPFGLGSAGVPGKVGNQGSTSSLGKSGTGNRSIFGKSSRNFSRGLGGFGRSFRGFRR